KSLPSEGLFSYASMDMEEADVREPKMTHFLKDILRQPEELRRTIELLAGPNGAGRRALAAATAAVRGARHVYLTGIGSSWHAALNLSVLFHQHAHPVYLHDAAELLTFANFPQDSAITASLSHSFAEAGCAIPRWQEQIAKSDWLAPRSTTYFLARGSSLGSAYESRLMWEEGVKTPATAMGTGSFRHGPQEIVAKNVRFGIWIDGVKMREQDLAVARDLRKLGARGMLIGQRLPEDAGDFVFQLPTIPAAWQFF